MRVILFYIHHVRIHTMLAHTHCLSLNSPIYIYIYIHIHTRVRRHAHFSTILLIELNDDDVRAREKQ